MSEEGQRAERQSEEATAGDIQDHEADGNGAAGDDGQGSDDEYLIEIDEDPCDNVAFLFLKPTAQTDSVKALLEKVLRDRSISILATGEVSCGDAAAAGLVEKHHSVKARFALKPPSRHPEDIETSIVAHLGGSYTDLMTAGKLISAAAALKKFACTPKELYDLWLDEKNGPCIHITYEFDVKPIASKEGVYVINGYYPYLQASLSGDGEKLLWYSVSWPEQNLKWSTFQAEVIGCRNPKEASPTSFRGILLQEWSSLGLASPPNELCNGIHCSGSPLEAIVDRAIWASVPFEEDPLCRIVRERYSDNGVELCRQWMANNRISINEGPFRPTFEEVFNNQTSEFLDAIGQNVANDEAFLRFRAERKAQVDLERSKGEVRPEDMPSVDDGGDSQHPTKDIEVPKTEGTGGEAENRSPQGASVEAAEVPANGARGSQVIPALEEAGETVNPGGPTANSYPPGEPSHLDGEPANGPFSTKASDANDTFQDGQATKGDAGRYQVEPEGGSLTPHPPDHTAPTNDANINDTGSVGDSSPDRRSVAGSQANGSPASSPSKTLHSRRSFIKTSTIVADDEDRWVDTAFTEAHNDMCKGRWTRVGSLYPGPKPGDSLLPDNMCIEHVAHGAVEDSFFYVSLSALLTHPGVVQHAFLTKEVRKDGRYTFQFYRWDRWEVVEVDDTIMLNDDGQTLFCYSPTNHWWPLLLEKAYAKFYKGYSNIINGSVVEAMHDLTSKPVINMGLSEELRMRINFQSPQDWSSLGESLVCGTYAATVVAHLNEDDLPSPKVGIRAADSYGIRRIIKLPGDADDKDAILVELYCPYRRAEYTGPWCSSDSAAWSDEAVKHVEPPFKRDFPEGSSPEDQAHIEHRQRISSTIYLPLEVILANFKSLQLCYLGAVKPKPFYYTDEWSEGRAGGNANFSEWRTNPKYVATNQSDSAVTVVATIKQHDQRSLLTAATSIKYLSCGMTLVQQNAPAAPPREPDEDEEVEDKAEADDGTAPPAPLDHYIHTPFVTAAMCKYLHRGVYINQREVSNEIVLPPHSTCYLIPATLDAGTFGNFMLTVFVPDTAGEDDVIVGPLEPYVNDSRPLTCSFTMKANQRVKLSLRLETTLMRGYDPSKGLSRMERAEMHVLLRQEKSVSKEDVVGDTVMNEYFALALHDPHGDRLPGSMNTALNYREMTILARASPTKGVYTVWVICAKTADADEELPLTVTALLPDGCLGERSSLTIQTNPPPKPLDSDEEDFPPQEEDQRPFGDFAASPEPPQDGSSASHSSPRHYAEIRSNSIRERPRRRSSREIAAITAARKPVPPPAASSPLTSNPRHQPTSPNAQKAAAPTTDTTGSDGVTSTPTDSPISKQPSEPEAVATPVKLTPAPPSAAPAKVNPKKPPTKSIAAPKGKAPPPKAGKNVTPSPSLTAGPILPGAS